jgi:hypothetical protein
VDAAHKADALQQVADKVHWASFDHLGIQLFVSNLKPVIRDELMKAPPATINAAIKMSRSLEKIHIKSDNSHATISEIQPQQQQHGDTLLDAEIEALSAQFQALLKRRNGGNAQRRAAATATATEAEAEAAEEEGVQLQAITSVDTARNRDTSKKSVTPASKPERRKSTLRANHIRTPMNWTPTRRRKDRDQPPGSNTTLGSSSRTRTTSARFRRSTAANRILSKRRHCAQK